jgi:hypothetical protein
MRRTLRYVTLFSLCALPSHAVVHTASSQLDDQQFARFYARFTGKWKPNNAKSIFLKGTPPPVVTYSYVPVPGQRAIKYNDVVHTLDGREWPVSSKPTGDTVAREVLDEFTVGNTLRQNGRIAARNTTVLSPDGKTFVVVSMDHDERGEWSVSRVVYYERQE